MGDWKKEIVALLEGLIVDIQQDDSPEDALLDIERITDSATDILNEAIED